MATWTQADLDRIYAGRHQAATARDREALPPKPRSKYRNVKTTIGGETFDSQREAEYWLLLQARQQGGEINSLQRQVPFALCAPDRTDQDDQHSRSVVIAHYVADFSYYDREGKRHVVDAKGHRTREYALKAKWLALQDGILVEEV